MLDSIRLIRLGGLLLLAAPWLPWLHADHVDLHLRGWEMLPGALAGGLGLVSLLSARALRSARARLGFGLAGSSLAFALALGAFAGAYDILGAYGGGALDPEEWIRSGAGLHLAGLGAVLLALAAARAHARAPDGERSLEVTAYWRGHHVRTLLRTEPETISVGSHPRCTLVLPAEGVARRLDLLSPVRAEPGAYVLRLPESAEGALWLAGRAGPLHSFREERAARPRPSEHLVRDYDLGAIRYGGLEICFRFVRPVAMPSGRPMRSIFESRLAHAALVSLLFHCSAVLWVVSRSAPEERAHALPRPAVRQEAPTTVVATTERPRLHLPDPDDRPLDGASGRFGLPDEPRSVRSHLPRRAGPEPVIRKPDRIGLNDVLSSRRLGGSRALGAILSPEPNDLERRLAMALEGDDRIVVVGHAFDGLDFRGSEVGRDGPTGYGLVPPPVRRRPRKPRTVRATLGSKPIRPVPEVALGPGQAGYCNAADIRSVVEARAGQIRACYERELQTQPDLDGRIVAIWEIDLDGRVREATSGGSTLGDLDVERCLLRTLRRMRFARPDRGVCIVRWPFIFRRAAAD